MRTTSDLAAPARPLASARAGTVLRVGLVALGGSALLRTVLALYTWDEAGLDALGLLQVLGRGALEDVRLAAVLLGPVAIWLALVPARWIRSPIHRGLSAVGVFVTLALLLFFLVAEWFFWEEFQARPNFIALDYLVYTNEVVGNVLESYPVYAILGAIGLVALALTRWTLQPFRRTGTGRAAPAALALAAPLFLGVYALASDEPPQNAAVDNRIGNELEKNGLLSLVDALRNPILDYRSFYPTLPSEEAYARVRAMLADPGVEPVSNEPDSIARRIPGTWAPPHNVVLVVVESLSASFMGCYGSPNSFTPRLDALAPGALVFDNVFATGCRTVRGLEAITLSVPPTPGRSIVRRDDNEGLCSIGTILEHNGYDTKFIYGGYGYFDEMNSFFGGNGFAVIDRASLENTTFTNAWGVCDQDIFARVLEEADRSAELGQPFMSLVLTTSNHRPYTFPSVPGAEPGSGREGAVRYTDYALDELLTEAREHPWFDDTIFVIVADHCAHSAGKREIDLARHHIPLLVWAPGLVAPGHVDTIGCQIDVAPTLLAMLGMGYESRFFGYDLREPRAGRALLGNYQSVGLYRGGRLTLLSPVSRVSSYRVGPGLALKPAALSEEDRDDTIAYYQTAAELFANGGLMLPAP